ncbi:unnamed protein product (macronuclear) [Paramecium tetraurelia]|uniref:UBC core domain-containing protein n=1 Tax=Paramecium tetraurelia TaxID=5888 RepID=A0CFN6_PARTE|nr:uncharacterized protein GSPATT00038043001 [Paramecium tetraurelia]CAK69603.1 unnamed protein product [Paramecium tetraurelia]|eukprot:XP_001437000.1 hypothetical protein (macronuclear) [Paramecium tetraurelia strain d4-2]
MFKFSNKRMEYEEQMLEENSDALPPNVQYKRIDRYNYVLQIRGEKGSVHDDVSLNGFPVEAPQVNFRNSFQHVNIFPMGRLCLYLVNKETWISSTSLIDVFSGINQVIHYPTFNDPANSIYKDPEVYDKDMKEQAKKFRDEKYKII